MGYALVGAGENTHGSQSGVDIRQSLSPDLTGVVSVRPDFRSVEQQVQSVNFSYTQQYLSDSRPFFVEGNQYLPGSTQLYTHSIADMDYGGKFTGKIGDYDVGVMHVQGFSDAAYDVARICHYWADEGHLEASAVHCNASALGNLTPTIPGDTPGFDNLVATVAGDRMLCNNDDNKIDLTTFYSVSDPAPVKDPITGKFLPSGQAMGSDYNVGVNGWDPSKVLHWGISHQVIDPNYNPRVGYIPETNISTDNATFWYGDQPTRGKLQQWISNLYFGSTRLLDGPMYHNYIGTTARWTWRNGTRLVLNWNTGAHLQQDSTGAPITNLPYFT